MNKLRCLLSVEFGFPHPIRRVFIPTIKLTVYDCTVRRVKNQKRNSTNGNEMTPRPRRSDKVLFCFEKK